ncbi:calcineurin-like phosphoesterase [Aureococcus anophagefferens]|nr:calcineurin-like phosphoesterase [Aureococcus anophagefferens]
MPRWMFTDANCDAYRSSDAITFANGQTVDGAALDEVLGGAAGAEFGDALCAGVVNASANATGANWTTAAPSAVDEPHGRADEFGDDAGDGGGDDGAIAQTGFCLALATAAAAPTAAPSLGWAASCGAPLYDVAVDGGDLLANNLGGRGPGNGSSATLRYGSVTYKDGDAVDLVLSVSAGTAYDVPQEPFFSLYQGRDGAFGQVLVRDNSTASLVFSFVDAATSEPVELEKFYVTFFDVDRQKKFAKHSEKLCVDAGAVDGYVLGENSELAVDASDRACDGSPGASLSFEATAAGFLCDNPSDPHVLEEISCADCDQCNASGGALDAYFPIDAAARAAARNSTAGSGRPDQTLNFSLARRAVSLAFEAPRSSFEIHYEIPCESCFLKATAGFDGGRAFLFGGASRSLCDFPTPSPTVPPTPGPAYVVVATVELAGLDVATAQAYAGVFLDAFEAAAGVAADNVTFAAARRRLGGRRLDDGGGVAATFTVEAETYAEADAYRADAAPAAETPVETPLVDDGASFFPGGARLSRAHADPDTIDVEVEPVRRREAPRAAAEAPLSELLFCAPTAGESDLQCMTRVLTCSEQGDARLLTCSKDGDTKFG